MELKNISKLHKFILYRNRALSKFESNDSKYDFIEDQKNAFMIDEEKAKNLKDNMQYLIIEKIKLDFDPDFLISNYQLEELLSNIENEIKKRDFIMARKLPADANEEQKKNIEYNKLKRLLSRIQNISGKWKIVKWDVSSYSKNWNDIGIDFTNPVNNSIDIKQKSSDVTIDEGFYFKKLEGKYIINEEKKLIFHAQRKEYEHKNILNDLYDEENFWGEVMDNGIEIKGGYNLYLGINNKSLVFG